MKALLYVFSLLVLAGTVFSSPNAYAAKVRVTWTAPTLNNDGSPLTDLTGYRIEWGSCNTDGSFGVYQAGINVSATATFAWIYPTGIAPTVCVRAYSINSVSTLSVAAYASGPVIPPIGQPVH